MRTTLWQTAIALAAVAVFTPTAFAHRMDLEATNTAANLRVVAGYEDGLPSEGAKIECKTMTGETITTGATDETGLCLLPRLTTPGRYKIIATDDLGHRATLTLEIPDETETETIQQTWRPSRPLMGGVGLAVIGLFTALWSRRAKARSPEPN